MNNLIKKLASTIQQQDLLEGFSGYTVNDSDSAADLFDTMLSSIAKTLSKGMADKGNSYNTPGYINVAMIAKEYLKPFAGKNGSLDAVVKKAIDEYYKSDSRAQAVAQASPDAELEEAHIFKELKRIWK